MLPSHIKEAGTLQLIFGPMFSGKTSELIRKIRRYSLCSYKCIVVRYANDDRYSSDSVATHDGITLPAISAHKLQDVDVSDYEVVGIDEGQFFADVETFVKTLLKAGKIVLVAGLDATYRRTPFECLINLVPYAHVVEKLMAVCMSCGDDASFTKRTCQSDELEVIGGLDMYMAVCRECYKLETPQRRTPFKRMSSAPSTILEGPTPPKKQLFVS